MIKLHIFLSTFALFVICLAGLQAITIAIQDRCIRQHRAQRFLSHFPPLEIMEKILFQLIGFGFFLLSLVLITSIIFFHPLFIPSLLHKTFLTISAWCVFAGLLIGRHYWGWRGRVAIRWTLAGVSLVLIIYCGTGLLLHVTE